MNSLKLPTILKRIEHIAQKSGFGDDTPIIQANFLSALSCFTKDNIGFIYKGSAGSGKSTCMEMVKSLIPTENIVSLSHLSEKALLTLDLDKKALFIDEMSGAKTASYFLRDALTSDNLSYAHFNKKSNNVKERKAQVSITTSTAVDRVEHQFSSRCIALELSNSEKRRKEIIEYSLKVEAGEIVNDFSEEIKEIHEAIRNFKYPEVRIPFATQLNFSSRSDDSIRKMNIAKSLIKLCTFLNQQNREIIDGKIIATVEDYAEVFPLIEMFYKSGYQELSNSVNTIWECLKDDNITSFTMDEFEQKYSLKHATAHNYVSELCNKNYLTKSTNKKGREKIIYTLDESKTTDDLIHPSQLLANIEVTEEKESEVNEIQINKSEVDSREIVKLKDEVHQIKTNYKNIIELINTKSSAKEVVTKNENPVTISNDKSCIAINTELIDTASLMKIKYRKMLKKDANIYLFVKKDTLINYQALYKGMGFKDIKERCSISYMEGEYLVMSNDDTLNGSYQFDEINELLDVIGSLNGGQKFSVKFQEHKDFVKYSNNLKEAA